MAAPFGKQKRGILSYFSDARPSLAPDAPRQMPRPPVSCLVQPAATTVAYTDGSCVNNGHRNAVGGIGVYFGPGDPRNTSERIPAGDKATNQTMELLACLRAIDLVHTAVPVPAHTSVPAPSPRLTICTDSEYVVKSMNSWARGWERNGWLTQNKRPVANQVLLRRLFALKNRHCVTFVHVPAHRSEPRDVPRESDVYRHWLGNLHADRLATQATGAPP